VSEVGIGVIGAGGIARNYHLPAFQRVDGARLIAVCDIDEQSAREAASRFAIPHWTTDFRALLRRSDIEAVAVFTTYHPKREIILAAVEAGKHVFTQKPLAGSVAVGEELVAAAERANVRLVTSFMHRYQPESRAARALLEAGAIGSLDFVRHRNATRKTFDRAVTWAGGVLDIGPHGIDLLRYLTGRSITKVQALTDAYSAQAAGDLPRPEVDAVVPGRPVETLAVCNYEFDNGLLASHEIQWTTRAGVPQFSSEYYGQTGTLLLRAPLAPGPLAHRTASDAAWAFPDLPTEPTRGVYHHQLFVDDVRNDTRHSASARDGLATLRVLEAIYVSARDGVTVTLRGG